MIKVIFEADKNDTSKFWPFSLIPPVIGFTWKISGISNNNNKVLRLLLRQAWICSQSEKVEGKKDGSSVKIKLYRDPILLFFCYQHLLHLRKKSSLCHLSGLRSCKFGLGEAKGLDKQRQWFLKLASSVHLILTKSCIGLNLTYYGIRQSLNGRFGDWEAFSGPTMPWSSRFYLSHLLELRNLWRRKWRSIWPE